MDGNIWSRGCEDLERIIDAAQPNFPMEPNDMGSPVSRSWKLFHPCPRQPRLTDELGIAYHFRLIIRALFLLRRKIKHFEIDGCNSEALPPSVFDSRRDPNSFAEQVIFSLDTLETLSLKITPKSRDEIVSCHANDLYNALPHVLCSIKTFQMLDMQFTPVRGWNWEVNRYFRVCSPPCYSYNDVFTRSGRWFYLTRLSLSGLMIKLQEFLHLLVEQAPKLTRLWLKHIDLEIGRWEAVVEMLRYRSRWDVMGLQGKFRHLGGEWWPCHPDIDVEEMSKLREYVEYIDHGGKHPGLGADGDDAAWMTQVKELFD